jgi:hypothetical protein
MRTAGRETQNATELFVASRDQGTEGENNPAQWGGLDGKKKSGYRRSIFFLTPFIELIRLSVALGPQNGYLLGKRTLLDRDYGMNIQ